MFKKTIIVVLCCFSLKVLAQNNNSSQELPVVIDVLAVYEDVVNKGYSSAQVYRTLARGRFLENNYYEAKKWLELLLELEPEPKANDLLLFSRTLSALNEKQQARRYFMRYEKLLNSQGE